MATALAGVMSWPTISLAPEATPIQPLERLAATLGTGCPRLFIKRDDLLSFGGGGNKVRKLQAILAEAMAAKADTLITCGGVQSNHARATAAAGAVLGLRVILVLSGDATAPPTGNILLDQLFGAELRYVATVAERGPAMTAAADALRAEGRRPFVIPIGGSTAVGVIGYARALVEIAAAGLKPTAIVHASVSGGTQAGTIAGCSLFGLRARVVGVSAKGSAADIGAEVTVLLHSAAEKLGAAPSSLGSELPIEVDDRFVGDGYGLSTAASIEAAELLARREGIVLDPVYTAKAMAALIARIRAREFDPGETILFWHTGGIPGVFA